MFARPQCFVRKRSMGISMRCDNDEAYVRVCKEVVCSPVVCDIWKIDSAMRSFCRRCGIRGSFCSLKNSNYLVVGNCVDEWQMKALRSKSVAYNADLDFSHVVDVG
jgi:hypothetical protein